MLAQPKAIKKTETFTEHGQTRTDDYFWMRERDSKEVLEYIRQENDYSSGYFDGNKSLTDILLNEFEQRIDPNEVSAPMVVNGNTLQHKNVEGKDYQEIHLLTTSGTKLFFDENERAKGNDFYQLGDYSFSTSNTLFAFSEDVVGRRKYTIRFMDIATRKILKDAITNTDGTVVWANDNKTVYYIKKDPETLREYQIFRHTIGTDPKKDVLVFEENDEAYYLYLTKTIDNAYICINAASTTTSDVLLLDANSPNAKPEPLIGRVKDHLYEVEHTKNGFYFLSNYNAADRAVYFSKNTISKIEDAKALIAHRPGTYIEGFQVLNAQLVLAEKTKGTQQLISYGIDGKMIGNIVFDEPVYEINLVHTDDPETQDVRYFYQSFTVPYSLYSYNFGTKKTEKLFSKALRGEYNPEDYQSERVWIDARDGTKVPVSLVYKKGTDLKHAPLLLYGYGSYGVTIPCNFSALRLSLLNRGFVYAIAHIRGGKFLGEDWYQDGKLMHKKNTFTDFIDCAHGLAASGYGDSKKIYAQGGSAGGLLMGAVVNMAPETFKGIVAQVPFVDVMNTMLDASLPLTVGEYEEWGNPNEKAAYDYMLSYSPYDNVQRVAYPSIFITTGYHDSQVQYWEPLKWIAKLREYTTGDAPLLFKCTFEAGHGGGSGVTNQRYEVALTYTYLLSLEGIEN